MLAARRRGDRGDPRRFSAIHFLTATLPAASSPRGVSVPVAVFNATSTPGAAHRLADTLRADRVRLGQIGNINASLGLMACTCSTRLAPSAGAAGRTAHSQPHAHDRADPADRSRTPSASTTRSSSSSTEASQPGGDSEHQAFSACPLHGRRGEPRPARGAEAWIALPCSPSPRLSLSAGIAARSGRWRRRRRGAARRGRSAGH